jgi:hypothetical protein
MLRVKQIYYKIRNILYDAEYYTIDNFTDKGRAIRKNSQIDSGTPKKVCFVLGNGPSLKAEIRLHELAQYTVFSVNQLYRSALYDVVNPHYHLLMDPLFFSLDEKKPEEADTLKRIRDIINTRKTTKFIFPVNHMNSVLKLFGSSDNYIFINCKYYFYEGFYKKIKLNRYMPANCNVVISAIEVAIALGYEKIILLGCDMTGILDSYIKRDYDNVTETFSHVYDYTSEEKERMQKVHESYSNEFMLTGFASMFRSYRLLYSYCKRRNIEILNATQRTALDAIPFCNLNEVLDSLEKE